MLPEYPLPTVPRQFTDVQRWLEAAISTWTLQAAQARVRIDWIVPSALDRIWTSPDSLNQIVDHFITDAIDCSISGDRIEVEVRQSADTADWLTIAVRDWAGGRSAIWNIDLSIQGLAKQLEGYIDVANHPGRSTVCSLHIPTGKLQGWLRRQPTSMLVHHVSCSPKIVDSLQFDACDSRLEEAIQLTLGNIGSFVPLGERAFLLSNPSEMDERTMIHSVVHFAGCIAGFELCAKQLDLRCDYLGTMNDFLLRIEQSLVAMPQLSKPCAEAASKVAVRSEEVARSSENTRHFRGAKGDNTEREKHVRIDAAGLSPTPLSDRSPTSSRSVKTPRNRIQPRRVSINQD